MASMGQQIAYDHWATLKSLQAMAAADSILPEARAILAHIVGISDLWISRVEGTAPRHGAWPELTLPETEATLAELRQRWLEQSKRFESDAPVRYASSSGRECVNSFGEVVQEMLLHGAHHRGQIALLLRKNGFEPPSSTDFIPALRSQAF